MLSRLAGGLTYANVMSTIAMFGVLATGGAYAASQIGAKDIAKNAVRAKHIKKNQVRAKHVKKNSVLTRHIRDGAVSEAKLADGLSGSPGPQGPPGPASGSAGGDLAGSYPNPTIADGAVGSAAVADGSLGLADLAAGSVNGAKVLDGSLTGADMASNTLTGAQVNEQSLNLNLAIRRTLSASNGTNRKGTTAECLSNEVVVGATAEIFGGGTGFFAPVEVVINQINLASDMKSATGWGQEIGDEMAPDWSIRTNVICARVAG